MTHIRALVPAVAVATALLSVALLTGCSGRTEAELIAAAKGHIAKADRRAALIELKGALQRDSKSAEARFLMGQTLFEMGDSGAALVELRKAEELNYPEDSLLPAMAKTLIDLRKFGEVIELYAQRTLANPVSNADLKTSVAVSYAAQGKLDKVKPQLDLAIASSPEYPRAKLLQARLRVASGDADGAISMVDAVIAADKSSVEALQTRGELLFDVKGDAKQSAQAYRAALGLQKDSVRSHVGLHFALMQLNDMPAIEEHQVAMAAALPSHPMTRFFAAQIAFLKNDFGKAKDLTQQLLKSNPEEPKFLQLAGMIAIQQQSWLQAENHLKKAVQLSDDKRFPSRLLAQSYLSSGQALKALETLRPFLELRNVDAGSLSIAAESYLLSGNMARAEEYFRRAAVLQPNDTKLQTALALSRLTKGDPDGAFGQLEKVAAGAPDEFADLALINARIMRNEFKPALVAIDALGRKDPKRPLAAHLRGRVLILQGDVAAARTSFENALTIDPSFYSSAAALAGLDLQEEKPDLARKRLEEFLQRVPKHVESTLALAEVLQNTPTTSSEGAKLVKDLIAQKPSEPALRSWLVERYLKQGDIKLAVSAAQEGAAALPDSADMADLVGRAQLASGDANQAVASFKHVTTLVPTSAEPLTRLADAFVAVRDFPAAAQSLQQALEISPRLLTAHRGLMNLSMRRGKYDEALAHARSMQKDKVLAPIGYLFEGDTEMSRNRYLPAVEAYRKGLELADLPEFGSKLHAALFSSGKVAEADKFANTWLATHPKDSAFIFHLGGIALAMNDLALAASYFDRVSKLDPNNASALNNVAWIKLKLKQPGALEAAQRASTLFPNSAEVMDTLAEALAADDKLPAAINAQKRALVLAPSNDGLKLNLAKLLARQGDKTGARAALNEISSASEGTPISAEAAKLSQNLLENK